MLIFLSALPMSYLAHAHAWIILSSMLWFLVFLQPTTQCVLHYLLCACSTEDTCLLLLPAREPSPLGAQDVEAHALLSSGVPGSNCHWWPRWLPLHFVQSKLRSPRHWSDILASLKSKAKLPMTSIGPRFHLGLRILFLANNSTSPLVSPSRISHVPKTNGNLGCMWNTEPNSRTCPWYLS